jgi:DNA-binding NtrC family response regulator
MRILLVDDENISRKSVSNFLKNYLGHQVTECDSGKTAFQLFKENPFPMVVTDIRMPVMTGMELLQEIKKLDSGKTSDVVLITGHGDLNSAVQALRSGAYDYLQKPIDVEELAAVTDRIAEHQALLKENYRLKYEFEQKLNESTTEIREKLENYRHAYAELMGVGKIGVFSDAMRSIADMAQRLHDDRSIPVLIEGETGTGKEIIARLIHFGRGDVDTDKPFVSINCSAISPTLFESEFFGYEAGAFTGSHQKGAIGKLELAQGGTIFLDEIGDLPAEMQPKLLRVLEQREFYRVGGVKKIDLNVRFICATNRNLAEQMQKGAFRKDLFYRLNTGRIYIPPLRERTEEIAPLAQMFLEDFATEKKRNFKVISRDAIKMLESYPWHGNVRELRNTIERVVLLYEGIEVKPEHLSFLSCIETPTPTDESSPDTLLLEFPPDEMDLETIEKKVIQKVLRMFDGNKTHAAKYLNITRNTLRRKLEK